MTTDSGAVTGFFHAGVTVRDMEASLCFYRDALGLTVATSGQRTPEYVHAAVGLSPESLLVTMLRVPGSEAIVELVEYRGIERHSGSCRPCDFGSGHLCLFVDDADAVHARLADLGYGSRQPVATIASGPFEGGKVVYTIDPDGYHVELYQHGPNAPSLSPKA